MTNAPITKVANNVHENASLFVKSDMGEIFAEEVVGGYRLAVYATDFAPATQTLGEFDNIQDLANAMRDLADLRTWKAVWAY